jgi:hypothetical protein
LTDIVSDVLIDFVIQDHPHFGYRIEERRDLQSIYVTTLIQGAFMGNTVMCIDGANFGSDDGWRGLVEWCLHLDAAVRSIQSHDAIHYMGEPDTDCKIAIERNGENLRFSQIPAGVAASANAEAFIGACSKFIRRSVLWITAEYPSALRHPDSDFIWARLEKY